MRSYNRLIVTFPIEYQEFSPKGLWAMVSLEFALHKNIAAMETKY
jgi:hypothetical protein